MRSARVHLALLAVLVSASSLATAQTPAPPLPPGIERVTAVEGITEYRLQNGLRVLLFPDPSKTTATVNMTYLVGSKHENYGETGMAHLLEHLVFKGTPRHPNIPKELSDHGSRPNGTTSWERTNYFETFEATDANLEWALDLEADRMVNSFISKADLDSEMTVVRNELESGENSPLNVLVQRVRATAFLWHNYGKPVIGARSDLENVPIDRLQAFYRRYYQPDNAMLVVAGKIDEAKTLALVAKYFGPVPRPDRALPPIYTSEPVQDGERSVTLRRVGDVQNIVVAFHVPSGSHADAAALQIASAILTDNTPSGRMYKALVETKQASNVGGGMSLMSESGQGLILAEVRKEASLDDARDTLLATLDAIATAPFTPEEIERARTRLLTNMELQLTSSETVGLQLSNWAALGDWRLLFYQRDRLKAVSAEDVQRTAAYYTKPANRTVGLFIPTDAPDRAEIPRPPDVAALLEGYTGGAAVAIGEAFVASPENIEARTRRITLPGGMKVILLPKETRGDVVSAMLRLNFGDETSLAGQSMVPGLAAQMLMRGTTKRSRQEIQDELDRLKARMSVGGGAGGVSVNIETTAPNLPRVLQLAVEVLRQPAFPAAEFETLRQQMLAGLEGQRTEPQAIASRAMQRHLQPFPRGDVRYVPTLDEQLSELRDMSVDRLQAFHSGFFGASHAELAVVGDFDPEAVLGVVSPGLGDWKSPKPFADITIPHRTIAPANEVFETPDKANAIFLAGLRVNVRDEDPDYPALLFANYLLGQGINSRLFARIRGREGLSYGIGSSFSVAPKQDSAIFMANAISAPENAGKVEAAFRDEITTLLRDGFTGSEISVGKTSWQQAQQVNRNQDAGLANRMGNLTHHGRTMAWDAELEKKVLALTGPQIQAALQRHLDLAKMTFMKGGDFEKAAAKP
jgi:zinc protease